MYVYIKEEKTPMYQTIANMGYATRRSRYTSGPATAVATSDNLANLVNFVIMHSKRCPVRFAKADNRENFFDEGAPAYILPNYLVVWEPKREDFVGGPT